MYRKKQKKAFTEQINGPYPIIRQFSIKSPYTGIIFHTTEHIYYDEEKDIFIGIMNNSKIKNDASQKTILKIAEKLRANGVSESIIKSSLE